MMSLVKTYDWLENKVIGNTPIITNIRYANFKMMNFLRSGNNLKCDEKIAEHQKIAAKWMSKRIFVLNLGLRLYPLIALFYLFTAILSPIIYSQNKNFWLVFPLFIPSILVVILIPLQKYRAEVSKRHMCLSLLVDSLLTTITGLDSLNQTSLNDLIQKLNKQQLEELDNLLSDLRLTIGKVNNSKSANRNNAIDNELIYKQIVLQSIEDASRYIEYYLPRQLRSKDIITDDWFKNSMIRAAAALREKKKWVLTPKEDTYENLIAYITTTLVLIVNGNWDALERVEPDKFTRPNFIRLFLSHLSKILKVCLIGMSPLIFFIVYQLTPFAFTGANRDYIFIVTLFWLGLTILISFDSTISAKLSLMRDAKNLFSSKDTNFKE